MENINNQIKDILVKVNKTVETNLDKSTLVTDGNLDSLDIMNIIMDLERKFDIEIEPEDVLSENFESVKAIAALVEKCKKK